MDIKDKHFPGGVTMCRLINGMKKKGSTKLSPSQLSCTKFGVLTNDYNLAVKSLMNMRKRATAFLFFLFILSNLLNAQTTFRGVVATYKSKEPVSFAHVYFADKELSTFFGTISDIDGKFEIKIPLRRSFDTLNVSCIGFDRLTISLKSINRDTVYLRPSTTQLPTIIISNLSAKEFIRKSISNVRTNYKNSLFRNFGFNWQSLMADGQYQFMNQSYVTIEEKHLADQIIRNISYDSTVHLYKNYPVQIIPTYDSLKEHLYFDLVKTGPGILNSNNLDDWDFSYAFPQDIPTNSDIVVIEAVSKGRFRNNFTFYIDSDDYAFLKISYKYSWPGSGEDADPIYFLQKPSTTVRLIQDTVQYKLKEINGVIQYEKTANKYNLKYLFSEINYTQYVRNADLTLPVKKIDSTLESELVITYSKLYSIGDKKFQKEKEGAVNRVFEPSIIRKMEFDQALRSLHQETNN